MLMCVYVGLYLSVSYIGSYFGGEARENELCWCQTAPLWDTPWWETSRHRNYCHPAWKCIQGSRRQTWVLGMGVKIPGIVKEMRKSNQLIQSLFGNTTSFVVFYCPGSFIWAVEEALLHIHIIYNTLTMPECTRLGWLDLFFNQLAFSWNLIIWHFLNS